MSIKPIAMRDALLKRILLSMEDDESIFCTCADFGSPCWTKFARQFPERLADMGIADQKI